MALYIYEAKGLARNDLIFMFMGANVREFDQWTMGMRGGAEGEKLGYKGLVLRCWVRGAGFLEYFCGSQGIFQKIPSFFDGFPLPLQP
jgi:hypothetical protein